MTKHNPNTPVPDLDIISAYDLCRMDLPPIRMVVGDCLPAGLILMAGDPKIGKSMVMQHLAVCIALGRPAWGSLEVEAGDVLYLDNEGGPRSFRQRVLQMMDGEPAPKNLSITRSDQPLGQPLETQLDRWLRSASDPRLVVVDTFSSVAPEARGVNRQQEDYKALAGLADLAAQFPDTLVVVVHHTRKAESDDVMHRISGSQGMTAATDGNAVLTANFASPRCVLSIRPRNAAESELVLERDPETLRYRVVGTDETSRLSDTRQRILRWFADGPAKAGPKEVAAGTGLDYDTVRQVMRSMSNSGQLTSPERGKYQLPGRAE